MTANYYLLEDHEIEELLGDLYARENLSTREQHKRANLARTFHDRTGTYYAARLYHR